MNKNTGPLSQSIPPSDIEVEKSILARCLIYSEDEIYETLSPQDFYRTHHQKIYAVMRNLWKKKVNNDVSIILEELKSTGQLEEIGGFTYINKLLEYPISVDPEYSANVILKYAQLRSILEITNAVTKKCFKSHPDETENVIDYAQREILKIGLRSKDNKFKELSDIIINAIARAEELAENKGITGIPSGLEKLDFYLSGFQPGEFYVLAGRPSMGKTALTQTCIANSAKKEFKSGFFSLEMGEVSIANRFLAAEAGINSHKFRTGKFTTDDWQFLMQAGSAISEWRVVIDDTPFATYQEICRKARHMVREGVQIIWIDYLSFIEGDRKNSTAREIETVTRALKSTARELNIPIVLLAQLNRQCEQRPHPQKRPVLSDLRDSGAIEQDADVVLFLYRHSRYLKRDDDDFEKYRYVAELEIAKNRNGPTGVVDLYWNAAQTRFGNLVNG
jgi:replicative DNA helicase